MSQSPVLDVVAYHYVRDLPRTRFPRIRGLLLDAFCEQVADLRGRYQVVALETALDFLSGRYRPSRDLCLLTFDDGLKEHYRDVMPFLVDQGLPACFFPSTECLEGRVASVHKVHFLMAALDPADFLNAFLDQLEIVSPNLCAEPPAADVARAYPWDPPAVGVVKYLANFALPLLIREAVINALFWQYLGHEAAFASELYVTWDELRMMQGAGMTIGGHSHRHVPLPSLDRPDLQTDIAACTRRLRTALQPQAAWPFAYPYGRYDAGTEDVLRQFGYACAFTVETGSNDVGHSRFRLRRFDTNDLRPDVVRLQQTPRPVAMSGERL